MQVGLQYDSVEGVLTVALYKARLKDFPSAHFSQVYLKTIYRAVRTNIPLRKY